MAPAGVSAIAPAAPLVIILTTPPLAAPAPRRADHIFNKHRYLLGERSSSAGVPFLRDQMEDACKNAESSRGPWRVNGDSSTPARIFSLTCGSPRAAKGKAVFSLRDLSRLAASPPA